MCGDLDYLPLDILCISTLKCFPDLFKLSSTNVSLRSVILASGESLADACRICHRMRNHILFVDAAKEMRIRAAGEDAHIVATVRSRFKRDGRWKGIGLRNKNYNKSSRFKYWGYFNPNSPRPACRRRLVASARSSSCSPCVPVRWRSSTSRTAYRRPHSGYR